MTKRVLLFIDGLDELAGSDADREQALKLFKNLSKVPGVKMCLSSRPWNIFDNVFRGCPQLLLQELTSDAINSFVRGSLDESPQFQHSYLVKSGESQSLMETINEKAGGVFLWVRLVVEDLRKAIRDGASLRRLRRIVDDIPGDLDQYFKRILFSVEPDHRYEGSAILQTMLFATTNSDIQWPTRSLDLAYLDEEDVDFAMQPGTSFEVTNPFDGTLDYSTELMRRRLNSRCMGLVEVSPAPEHQFAETERALFGPRVMFLHRSLLDFLQTSSAKGMLGSLTGGPFASRLFLCNVLLAKCVTYGKMAQKGFNHIDKLHSHMFLAAPLTARLSVQQQNLICSLWMSGPECLRSCNHFLSKFSSTVTASRPSKVACGTCSAEITTNAQ